MCGKDTFYFRIFARRGAFIFAVPQTDTDMKTKRILTFAAACAAVAALAVSCCHCRSFQTRNRRPLVGTEWQLVQLGGESVRPEEGSFRFVLDAEGRVTGKGSCNRLTGTYTLGEKNALGFGAMASTRMACPDMTRETAYMQMFESVVRYDMDGAMLLLLDAGDSLLAVFQALPADGAE